VGLISLDDLVEGEARHYGGGEEEGEGFCEWRGCLWRGSGGGRRTVRSASMDRSKRGFLHCASRHVPQEANVKKRRRLTSVGVTRLWHGANDTITAWSAIWI